jgi:hypothetical protein
MTTDYCMAVDEYRLLCYSRRRLAVDEYSLLVDHLRRRRCLWSLLLLLAEQRSTSSSSSSARRRQLLGLLFVGLHRGVGNCMLDRQLRRPAGSGGVQERRSTGDTGNRSLSVQEVVSTGVCEQAACVEPAHEHGLCTAQQHISARKRADGNALAS